MADNFDDIEKRLREQAKLGEDLRKSTAKIAGSMKDYLELQFRLNRARKEEKELQEKINKLKEESNGIVTDEIKEHEQLLKKLQKENKELERGAKILKSQAFSVKNMSVAVSRDLLKGLKSVSKEVRKQSLEYFEQEKTIRRTAVNIGIVGKQQERLRSTLYKNALITQRWGMDAAELGETYGSYVDNVGRLVQLTDQASQSLAAMAMGTALGKEGSAEMASNMEVFGKSIEGTAKYVEDTLNYSEKMGLNSGKVLKTLNSNLRQANTVRFKDGIKGMMRMAALSTKLRMEMSDVLGLAQDLWEPERAIEVGASLQMMGGAFARMGDPLKLMYQGRNNPEQLAEDLAKAASESIKFKKATGEFDTSSMELHRLKTVANELGMDFTQILETAKTASKQNLIGKMLNPNIKDGDRDFIKNIAQLNDKGEFVVTTDKGLLKVSELNEDIVKNMMSQDKTLEDRAKEAQDSMSLLSNFMKSFKNLAYMFFKGLDDGLGGPIRNLLEGGQGSLISFGNKLEKWGKDFGSWISTGLIPALEWLKGGVSSFINGVSSFGKTISGVFGGDSGFKALVATSASMGNTMKFVGSAVQKLYGGLEKVFGKNAPWIVGIGIIFRKQIGGLLTTIGQNLFGRGSSRLNAMWVRSADGSMGGDMMGGGLGNTKMGKWLGKSKAGKWMNKLGPKLGKGLKIAGGLGVASLAMDIGRSFLENPNSDLGKSLGIGGSTLGDAGTGALIGSVIPGVGTMIGGLIGGIVGLGRGMYNEFSESILGEYDLAGKIKPKMNIGLGGASVATLADGVVSPSGNVIATKSGELWNTSPGDYIQVSRPQGSGGGSTPGDMNLNINGTLKIEANGTSVDASKIISDPIFVSELTRAITHTMKTQNR